MSGGEAVRVATIVGLPSSPGTSTSSTPTNTTAGIMCYHGIAALMDTSWAGINLGHRYARCLLEEVPDRCQFVEWINPELDDGSLRALTALWEIKDAAKNAMLSWKRQTRILTEQNLNQNDEVEELQTQVWQLEEAAQATKAELEKVNKQLEKEWAHNKLLLIRLLFGLAAGLVVAVAWPTTKSA